MRPPQVRVLIVPLEPSFALPQGPPPAVSREVETSWAAPLAQLGLHVEGERVDLGLEGRGVTGR